MDQERLLDELGAWCKARYGRQRQLALAIGVTPAMINDWIVRRKTPNLAHGLRLLEFLNRRRQRPSKKIANWRDFPECPHDGIANRKI
jgi:hypothetical protein